MKNYYDILGLEQSATTKEIQKAYRKLSIKFHPDHNKEDDGFFAKRFLEIKEAYETLKNPTLRALHDQDLGISEINDDIYNNSDLPINIRVAIQSFKNENKKRDIIRFNGKQAEIKWDEVFTNWVFNIKSEEYVGTPVKIVAMIESISNPYPIQLDAQTRTSTYTVSLQDIRGNSIDCINISAERFKDEIPQLFEKHSYCVFCGTVISIVGTKPEYKFFLDEIIHNVTPEDRFVVRPDPKFKLLLEDYSKIRYDYTNTIAEKFIKINNKGRGEIYKWIRKTIIDGLNIKALDKAKELSKCIDFMILQSISDGMRNGRSQRLHSLVIGPPSEGKGLLTQIAKVLNPVSDEIGSVSGKITMAGLIGDVVTKGSKKYSSPGYFAKTSTGVLCIQDFHNVRGATRHNILSVLLSVMEDGVVKDNTSARAVHEAITAVHLDMNNPKEMEFSESINLAKDIKIPPSILSRLDFIINIEKDDKRQLEVVKKIIKSSDSENLSFRETWQRDVRRMVAYMRTAFNYIDYSDEINEYIISEIEKIRTKFQSSSDNSELIQKVNTRLGISIKKYTKAIANVNCDLTAKQEYVDRALEFVEEKLKFLYQIESTISSKNQEDYRLTTPQERRIFLQNKLSGQVVTNKQVAKALGLTDSEAEKKVVYNTLIGFATHMSKGKWRIPK